MEDEYDNTKSAFIKKLILIIVFLTITPLTLVASAISLTIISGTINPVYQESQKSSDFSPQGVQVYASLPSTYPTVSAEIIVSDARSDIIKNFLRKYNSPLVDYADYIVQVSDNYSLDYRLITAIAMKESGLCKAIPEDSYNCWGWGIHKNGTLRFDSFEEGINTVSKGLKENYVDIGLTTVEEIMSKYIPHSPGGAWASDVTQYMSELR